MKTTYPVVLLALFLAFPACKSETKKEPSGQVDASIPSLDKAPPAVKPEMYLYYNTVKNLLLRDKPTQTGSKVITKFEMGDFLEGTGVISDNKEEATIRNIPMEEPFYEVISTTPEQYKGWAFGGALLRVYAGPRATAPDLGQLSQYTLLLRTLNIQKLESGKKAWDYIDMHFKNAKGTLADAVYIISLQLLRNMQFEGNMYNFTEKIDWKNEDYEAVAANRFDMNTYPITQKLAENGFTLAVGEGSVFPVPDMRRLHDFFVAKVTPPMKEYILQELLEFEHQAYSDGGIIIPLEQLADRAIFWEKFNQQHPYFLMMEQTKESQKWTAHSILRGDNNTPFYYSEDKKIIEDFKKVWTYVIQKYPETDLGKNVRELFAVCEAEGWKYTEKVEKVSLKYTDH
jgi:hypothetical protein